MCVCVCVCVCTFIVEADYRSIGSSLSSYKPSNTAESVPSDAAMPPISSPKSDTGITQLLQACACCSTLRLQELYV